MNLFKTRRKLTAWLCLVIGLFLTLMAATAIYILLIHPHLEPVVFRIYASMGWLWLCQYLYYKGVRRYTTWWRIISKE